MRAALVILFTAVSFYGFSQFTSHSVKQDTCLDRKISVVFYVILNESYVPNVSSTIVNYAGLRMDSVFSRVCISFMNCSTVTIPVFPYRGWHKLKTEPAVKASWYTENALNIYVVDTCYIGGGNFEPYGYSYPPTAANLALPKKDLIVIEADKFAFNRCAFLLHLVGTYLGLPHTFDEIGAGSPASPPPPPGIGTQEFANQSQPNCSTHGDGFCDTEADPGFACGCVDGMGNYYIPPLDNFMSHYVASASRYTGMQYYRMVYNLMTKRNYLH